MDHEEIIKQLSDLVFKRNICVSCYYVSKNFEIHISEAEKVLEDFVKKNSSKLVVDYVFWCVGSNTESDVPLHRFLIVSQDEFDSFKSSHVDFKWRIYSTSALKNLNLLDFDKFFYKLSTANIAKAQSLTYLRNSGIGIRSPRRSGNAQDKKNDSTNAEQKEMEKKEEEPKSVKEELMETEVTKNTAPQMKRPNSKDHDEDSFNGYKKKRKRVQILDSDEDEEEKPKRRVDKEECQDMDGFTVTKFTEVEDKPKPLVKTSPELKNEVDKTTSNNSKKANVLKSKIQKQTSIMSFFAKKPAVK